MLGAVIVRVRSRKRGLPPSKSAVCLVRCASPGEATPVLTAAGAQPIVELGWADEQIVRDAGSAAGLIETPPPGCAGVAAGLSFALAARPGSADAAWEACVGEGEGLAWAAGLAWGPKPEARRFVRTRAEAESALAWARLPCLPLGPEESVEFRQRWRERHLRARELRSRLPGKPAGSQTKAWSYDWDALADAEVVTAEDVALRLNGAQAVFFEPADLPVYVVPEAYWRGDPIAWPCDVYIASYPRAGATAAFDHEGLGPYWSEP
jgi:hypothetical protein